MSSAFFSAWLFLLNQQVNIIVLLFQLITSTYDLITLPIYYLLVDKPWKIERQSTKSWTEEKYEPNGDYKYWELKSEAVSHQLESFEDEHRKIRNSVDCANHLSELLAIVQQFHSNSICAGTRTLLGKVIEDEKTKFKLADHYEWFAYKEVLEKIFNLAEVLQHKFKLKKGDRVAMMLDTSLNSLITFFALQCLGCQVVTLHSTSDDNHITFILNLTKPKHLFTQTELVRTVGRLRSTIETVSTVICIENKYVDQLTNEEKLNLEYEFFEFDQLLEEKTKIENSTFSLSNFESASNDVAVIFFTSGSTGKPKGVQVTHSNILKGVRCFMDRIPFQNRMSNDDTFLAYLPASHIFEMMCEITFFTSGVKLAYGKVTTLSTCSQFLSKNTIGDIQASETTIWLGVPLIFERVRNQIQKMIKNKISTTAGLYGYAYEYKRRWNKLGFECSMTNELFFRTIQNEYGGRLRYLITGGAPIMPETSAFLKAHLNVKLILSYGSTESTAACASVYDQFDHANTMTLHNGVKLRLIDWQEGGYFAEKDKRGEIILGGDPVSIGYLDNPEEESLFEENGTRWWRSGDIGEIDEYGNITIIDRKKNLVKLQDGKYVALGKSEAILKNCSLVENIVLHADLFHNHMIAILLPNLDNIRKLAELLGRKTDQLEELLEDEGIKNKVLEELIKHGISSGLLTREIPYIVKLCSEMWSPKNGLLTASMKVNRQQIYSYYKQSISSMYKKLEIKFLNRRRGVGCG